MDDENCVFGMLNRLISISSGSCWCAVLTLRFNARTKSIGKCMTVLLDIVQSDIQGILEAGCSFILM
jgi:hypothetical protein